LSPGTVVKLSGRLNPSAHIPFAIPFVRREKKDTRLSDA
jgi:hypothetical protein